MEAKELAIMAKLLKNTDPELVKFADEKLRRIDLPSLAEKDELKYVPTIVLRRYALKPNIGGLNLMETAAQLGILDQLPKSLITKSNLIRKDECDKRWMNADEDWPESYLGKSVLHFAAQSGCLDQIPQQYLTQETMVRNTSHEGWSPFALAILSGNAHQLPTSLFTKENLMHPEKYERPAIEMIIDSNIDNLLGIQLPEEVRELIPQKWWARNQALTKSKNELSESEEILGIDIF